MNKDVLLKFLINEYVNTEESIRSVIDEDLGINIIVLQRGWVVVGSLSKHKEYYQLIHGSVIRKWGTECGLGQIAENGPTSNTVLDKITDCNFHELTTVLIMKCNEKNWKDYVKN